MIYWDSSALIKKYLKEEGSNAVINRLSKDPVVATSQLTYAEIHSTFARKLREKEVSIKTYQATTSLFDADWMAMAIIRVEDRLLSNIRSLLKKHPLRSADSVHLASALYISEYSSETAFPFACSDKRLLQAALSEGLAGWDPIMAEKA